MKVPITFRPDHMLSLLWEHAHSPIPKLYGAARALQQGKDQKPGGNSAYPKKPLQ